MHVNVPKRRVYTLLISKVVFHTSHRCCMFTTVYKCQFSATPNIFVREYYFLLFERRHLPSSIHLPGDSDNPNKIWILTPVKGQIPVLQRTIIDDYFTKGFSRMTVTLPRSLLIRVVPPTKIP